MNFSPNFHSFVFCFIKPETFVKIHYMKKSLLTLFLSFIILQSFGQGGNDIKLSSLPYYNYGKGLGLTSPDSLFQFNIRFRIQNRMGYNRDENGNPSFDAQVRRLRLRFDGFVGDPRFVYVMQLSFAPGDVGEVVEGQNLNIIRDAIVFYRPNKHWNFGFGQTKLPGNRQRVNSSGALQLTDRSINNAKFNIDRDFGVQVNYLHEEKSKFSYNVKTAISSGEGRNWTKDPDDGLAYTGKIELLPLGSFTKDGIYFEGDQAREKKPKVMLSGAYHFNKNARREQGVLGKDLYEKRDLKAVFIDAMFKYSGFAFQAAYMSRDTDDPETVSEEDGSKRTVYVGHGYDLESSYLFKNNFELIGRYSKLLSAEKISLKYPDQTEFTVGLTKYMWEHAFKIQSELTFDQFEYYDGTEKGSWYLRFQVEMGI